MLYATLFTERYSTNNKNNKRIIAISMQTGANEEKIKMPGKKKM